MRSKILFTLICAVTLCSPDFAAAQGPLTETSRLAALAKVWGFLKYYHPGAGNQSTDWDGILLQAVQPVKKATTQQAFNREIEKVIAAAGNVNFLNYGRFFMGADEALFEWLTQDPLLDWYVLLKLRVLGANNPGFDNYYVQAAKGVGNTLYTNEKPCPSPQFPSEEYRLLALFRYWNIINYFYPYKDVIGADWDQVLDEFIPRLISASNALEYHLLVREFTARINDSHGSLSSSVLEQFWGAGYLPFQVRYIEGQTTQRIGIVPDIEVHPTLAGIRAGWDEVLQRAIDFINGK